MENNKQYSNDRSVYTGVTNIDSAVSNKQVAFEQTPLQELSLTPISPKYRRLNIATGLLFGLFAIAIILIIQTSGLIPLPKELVSSMPIAYGLILFFTVWNVIYHYFADPLVQYAVREQDLNFQSGLIFRSLVSQPILRIQHIEIKRGPLERKVNLATLQVYSAGGSSYTFNIPGLEYETAIQLRQFILDHKDLASDV